MTVGEALADAAGQLALAGSETPRLDAEVLLGHALGVDRVSLAAYPEAAIGDGQLASFRALVSRRALGEPVAYIRGLKEFHGLAFHVDGRVLIPRPETEALVDLALARIRTEVTAAPRGSQEAPYLVWDVGTGSGAIGVALASDLRRRNYGAAVRFHLSDVSADALAVAVENAVSHGVVDLMDFAQGDLVAPGTGPERPVDLLVANLPYIPSAMLPELPVAARFEPPSALDGGPDGLDLIRRLVPELPRVLRERGAALLEIGADQGDAVSRAALGSLPGWSVTIEPDLAGQPRVAILGSMRG